MKPGCGCGTTTGTINRSLCGEVRNGLIMLPDREGVTSSRPARRNHGIDPVFVHSPVPA